MKRNAKKPYGVMLDHSGPTGRSLIHLAFSNKKDPFSPTSIENSALAFYWHRFETGKYEVVAYVS